MQRELLAFECAGSEAQREREQARRHRTAAAPITETGVEFFAFSFFFLIPADKTDTGEKG